MNFYFKKLRQEKNLEPLGQPKKPVPQIPRRRLGNPNKFSEAKLKSVIKQNISVPNTRDVITISAVMLIIFLAFSWLFLSATGYFNLISMCRIRIYNDIIAGNEKTIKQAIRNLRQEDHEAYKVLCQNVDRIYERTCIGSDWHLDKNLAGTNQPGCYVLGSHAIYIKPDFSKTDAAIDLRAESIKKYSQLAQEYWNKQ
jgi:hypothetical protein